MSRRVMLVEDQVLMAMALEIALRGRGWEVEAISGPSAEAIVELAQLFQPDCVLLDLNLGNVGSGVDLIAPLMATGAHVVMLTAERRRLMLAECLQQGAAGWIGKGAALDEVDDTLAHVLDSGSVIGRADRDELLAELRLERSGHTRATATFEQLTHREALVLGALIDGLGAEEIAAAHFVALTTVRSQIRAVLQKLGVRSQLAAVAVASAHRELLPEEARSGRDRRRPLQGRPGGPDFEQRARVNA